jgi:hypothetical protein
LVQRHSVSVATTVEKPLSKRRCLRIRFARDDLPTTTAPTALTSSSTSRTATITITTATA